MKISDRVLDRSKGMPTVNDVINEDDIASREIIKASVLDVHLAAGHGAATIARCHHRLQAQRPVNGTDEIGRKWDRPLEDRDHHQRT